MLKRRLAMVFFCALAAGCADEVDAGLRRSDELIYRQEYLEAEHLCRNLLKRLDALKALKPTEEKDRQALLARLGELNAWYLRDYSAAVADYENFVRHAEKGPEALAARNTIADLYHHRLGNLDAAVAQYRQIIADYPLDPAARRAQLGMIAAFFQQKKVDLARAQVDALVKSAPDSREAAQARFELADSYYVQKRYKEAIDTYQALLKNKPTTEMTGLILFELGNCYQELGEAEETLTYYYAALPDHPNPTLVQRKISRLRARLHHTAPQSILNGQRLERRVASVRPNGALGTADGLRLGDTATRQEPPAKTAD